MATLAVTGCANQAQFLDGKQTMAMQTAVSRGQFEMNCPAATGTLLSKEGVQPALHGPVVVGFQRAEFTVGAPAAASGQRSWSYARMRGTAALPRAPAGS
jgi:hypothetical protein